MLNYRGIGVVGHEWRADDRALISAAVFCLAAAFSGGARAAQVYPGDEHCSAGDQWCADALVQRTLGGIKHGKVSWQNRPTYQQVVEFTTHR